MENEEILRHVDHTLLRQTATWEEIKVLCDEGIKYGVASVCIPPSRVRRAKEYVGDSLKICTVIGFPNGYATTETKLFEAGDAIANGADEIDMVIDVGALKERDFGRVGEEVRALTELCHGKDRILKVIVETCLLTEAEKIKMCESSPMRARTTSRLPQAFPRAARRGRISGFLPRISEKT